MRYYLWSLLLLQLFCFISGFAENKVEANKVEPPQIKLTDKQLRTLARGKPVYPPVVADSENSGSALAVFKVEAPTQFVWEVIKQFDQYPIWVDGVQKIEYYKPVNGQNIFVKFTVGKWFTPSFEYHISHFYPQLNGTLGTWSLDSSQKNDLTGCQGFWRVTADKDNPLHSVVEYSVSLKTEGVMLNIVRPLLVKNGTRDATSWVSKQAKIAYENFLAKEAATAKKS